MTSSDLGKSFGTSLHRHTRQARKHQSARRIRRMFWTAGIFTVSESDGLSEQQRQRRVQTGLHPQSHIPCFICMIPHRGVTGGQL